MADMRVIAPIAPAGGFAVTKVQYIEDGNGVRLDTIINEQTSRIAAYKADIDNLKSGLATVQTNLTENNEKIATNKTDIANLKTGLATVQSSIVNKEEKILHFKTWADYEKVKNTIPVDTYFVIEEDAGEDVYKKIEQIEEDIAVQTARIDQLVGTVPPGSGDEVADARVMVDGKTANNLGTAIRSQVTRLKEQLTNITDAVAAELDYKSSPVLYGGHFVSSTDPELSMTSHSKRAVSDIFRISKKTTITAVDFVSGYTTFIDVVWSDGENVNTSGWVKSFEISNTTYNYRIAIKCTNDSGDATLNTYAEINNVVTCTTTGNIAEKFENVNERMDDLQRQIDSGGKHSEVLYLDFGARSFWKINDDNTVTFIDSTTANYYGAQKIDISEYGELKLECNGGTSVNTRPYFLVDDNDNIVSMAAIPAESGNTVYDIIVPPSAKYICVSVYSDKINHSLIAFKSSETGVLYGKKLSVIGDSISAFKNTIPVGNVPYYTGTNSGVSSASQMWWNVLCQKTRMIPLVIDGWSGSCVADGIRQPSETNTYKPASNPGRCQNLHTGTDDPDIVLIAMGVNDFSYDSDASQFGNWSGKTALGTASDDSLSDWDVSSFETAYATMLARIQKKYPLAKIACITPWFCMRKTDNGATYVNSIGKTETDYADSIKKIADIMHVKCIDGTNIGFNRYNYYPYYCEDSASIPTHPNARGHEMMGRSISKQLLAIAEEWFENEE